MLKRATLIIILTFAIVNALADEINTEPNLFRIEKDSCLRFAESSVILQQPEIGKATHFDILQYAKSQIPAICERLIVGDVSGHFQLYHENDHGEGCTLLDDQKVSSLHLYYFRKEHRQSIESEVEDLHSTLISKCQRELTPEALLRAGGNISQMDNLVSIRDDNLVKEQKVLVEKNKELMKKRESEENLADAIKLAKQTERNFDIKGLNLKLSRQQIIAIAGQNHWQCSKNTVDPAIEVCDLEPTGKSCTSKGLIDPRTGYELRNRYGQILFGRNECTIVPVPGMPPEVKKLTTIGGQNILKIKVGFFNGTLFDYQIFVDRISPELKSGLLEKLGPPTDDTAHNSQWIGKDEILELSKTNAQIFLFRPSILESMKQHMAAKKLTDQNDEQRKVKVISEQNKKDF